MDTPTKQPYRSTRLRCVGGPCDGRHVYIRDDDAYVTVAHAPKHLTQFNPGASVESEIVEAYTEYVRATLSLETCIGSRNICHRSVLIPVGHNTEDLIDAFYTVPPKES